jgi:hypothetical protein
MYLDAVEHRETSRTYSLKMDMKGLSSPLPPFLAFKEIWRNKGRFLLVGLVIALITTLVLFIAGLAEGLGAGNIEYLQKLDAELVLFQEDVELSTSASQISVLLGDEKDPLDISLIGVEAGKPGEPIAYEGRGLKGKRGDEAVIGRNVALRTGLDVGDELTIKSVQGTDEELYRKWLASAMVSSILSDRRFLSPISPGIRSNRKVSLKTTTNQS